MEMNFSEVNLQYLIQARDLAKQDPVLIASLLGMPDDMARLIAELTPEDLAHAALIKQPLLIPRQAPWWWSRLFTAIREGRKDEIEAVLEHTPLIMVL